MTVISTKSEWFYRRQLRQFALISGLFVLLIGLLIIPQAWGSESKRDIVMMVDNSGSMKKNDPKFLAHRALEAFVSQNNDDVRLALITFDKNVNLTVPFTPLTITSRPVLFDAIKKIDYSGSLTNSPAALERAIFEIALHGRDDADKSIIFITDGIVDTGNKIRDRQQEEWMQEELSLLASKLNIRIFGIAFAEAANYQLLQTLVSKTEGDYFKVLTADELPGVFARLKALSRPVATPMPQEPPQPKLALEPQPTIESIKENQDIDENNNLSASKITETLSAEDPLESEERLIPPQPINVPMMLFNKARSFYTGKEVLIYSVTFVSLIALATMLLLRKSIFPGLTAKSSHDSTLRDGQRRAFLIDINNHTSTRNHPLSKRITKIGRVNGGITNKDIHHLIIDRPTIGREHALIEYKDESYWLIDQDSTNGTFIDGERIKGRVRLKDGNRFSFHDVDFIFSVPELSKIEKTVSVSAIDSRVEIEQDEDVIITRKADNRRYQKTPSVVPMNFNKADFKISAYRHPKDKMGIKSAKKDQEITKTFSTLDLQKRNSPGLSEDESHKSISDREIPRETPKSSPELKFYSQSESGTEKLDTDQLPDANIEDWAQRAEQSDTEEIQVIAISETDKKATDQLESIRQDTIKLDSTEKMPSSDKKKEVDESKNSDTEEILPDTFKLGPR